MCPCCFCRAPGCYHYTVNMKIMSVRGLMFTVILSNANTLCRTTQEPVRRQQSIRIPLLPQISCQACTTVTWPFCRVSPKVYNVLAYFFSSALHVRQAPCNSIHRFIGRTKFLLPSGLWGPIFPGNLSLLVQFKRVPRLLYIFCYFTRYPCNSFVTTKL